jgi:hypothetical protein
MGGGLALLLALDRGFAVSSVNYSTASKSAYTVGFSKEAIGRLDDVVREARNQVFPGRVQWTQPGTARKPPLGLREGLAQTANRAASLKERLVQTAHALHLAAADTATLLEQRAVLVVQPGQIDYPTEIKRWKAFADQAEQLTKHWEQRR